MNPVPVTPPAHPVPVVLAGARGHGRRHLENIRRLSDKGLVRLAGVCELSPLAPEELEGYGSPAQSADLDELLATTGAGVAVVCTPIHTHTDLALTAAARGVNILLEKPPAPSRAEFARMTEGVRQAGVACQIGFQSLGSHAIPAIRELVSQGAIGEPLGIGAAGAWVRDAAYFRRSPWAGKRRLGDVDVVDGVLSNPLAHAVATALALDGADRAQDVAGIELELFRAHAIEADDTSAVRVTTARGTRVTAAVTLCAETAGEPYAVVHGTRGRITFWYKQDRVLIQREGRGPEELLFGRTDLLENLVEHLAGRAELLVPPDRTGAFTEIVEALRSAAEPLALPGGAWHTEAGTGRRIVHGVDGLVTASAETLSLFSELGAPWAVAGPGGVRTA